MVWGRQSLEKLLGLGVGRPLLPFGRCTFSLAANYSGWMMLMEMGPPPAPLPPAGTEQVVESAEGSGTMTWLLRGHLSLGVFKPRLGPQPEQSRWHAERKGTGTGLTLWHWPQRRPGLVIQRRGTRTHGAGVGTINYRTYAPSARGGYRGISTSPVFEGFDDQKY